MEIGRPGPAARFSVVSPPPAQPVGGRIDFDDKAHMAHALIGVVIRQGSTQLKLLVKPELIRWGKVECRIMHGVRGKPLVSGTHSGWVSMRFTYERNRDTWRP